MLLNICKAKSCLKRNELVPKEQYVFFLCFSQVRRRNMRMENSNVKTHKKKILFFKDKYSRTKKKRYFLIKRFASGNFYCNSRSDLKVENMKKSVIYKNVDCFSSTFREEKVDIFLCSSVLQSSLTVITFSSLETQS